MVRTFRERDVFTMYYVYSKAGVDVVCAHLRGTSGGLVGFAADQIAESLARAQKKDLIEQQGLAALGIHGSRGLRKMTCL